MKHLFLLVSSVLILCTNVLIGQNSNTVDVDKKQLLEIGEQWGQQVIINGNLDVIKNFFPKNGVNLFYHHQKIDESTVEQTIKEFSNQFENVKYTSYNLLPDPYIFITEDGNTAIVSGTSEIEYEKSERSCFDVIRNLGTGAEPDGRYVFGQQNV